MTQSHLPSKEFNITHQTAGKVLDILKREFEHVPKEGIIAGGAVASALFEALEIPVARRYNDLDVFIPTKETTESFVTYKLSNQPTPYQTSPSMVECQFGAISKESYSILSTKMKGKINEIFIRINGENYYEVAETIINAFDLNCVQAAITLNNGSASITVTDDFCEFLNHQTIKPTNFFTGAHTLVRMLNKAEQQDLSIDDEAIDNLLCSISLANHHAQICYENNFLNEPALSGWLMADAYKEKMLKVAKSHNLPVELVKLPMSRDDKEFTLFKPVVTRTSSKAKQLIEIHDRSHNPRSGRLVRTHLHTVLNLLHKDVPRDLPLSRNHKINQILLATAAIDSELWNQETVESLNHLNNVLNSQQIYQVATISDDNKVNQIWISKVREILDIVADAGERKWLFSHLQDLLLLPATYKYNIKSVDHQVPYFAPEAIIQIVEANYAKRFTPNSLHMAFESETYKPLQAHEAFKVAFHLHSPAYMKMTIFKNVKNGKLVAIDQNPAKEVVLDSTLGKVVVTNPYYIKLNHITFDDNMAYELHSELACFINGIKPSKSNINFFKEATAELKNNLQFTDIPF
ncbi:hypothetical protein F7U66_01980 [Vibrio parahaemolyticus]|nr:hypothetical protein [Vibrio parahaemolyticus]